MFYKISGACWISSFIKLFFYRKIGEPGLGSDGPSPQDPAHGSKEHIKPQSLILWSAARIECVETVSLDLISSVNLKTDGRDLRPSEPIRTTWKWRCGHSPQWHHGNSGGLDSKGYYPWLDRAPKGKWSGGSRRSYPMVFVGSSGSAKDSGGGGFCSPLRVSVRQLRGIFDDQMASGGGGGFSSSS
jgi:hypothetical protein